MAKDFEETKDTPDVDKLKRSDYQSSKTIEHAVQGLERTAKRNEKRLAETKDLSSVEAFAKPLEREGLEPQHAHRIAQITHDGAEGAIARDDWMTLEASRFKEETNARLVQEGLTPEVVVSNSDKAELYASRVFEYEGIPDGNGGTEKVRRIAPGHFSSRGWGIDLVAANSEGKPIPIEVKKYGQPSAAQLSDGPIVGLEDETERWLQQGALLEQPVQQMDEWWVRDRWLKLIKSPEGQKRMADLGVNEGYLDHDRLRSSPDLPEWEDFLDRRTTVIVSGGEGDAGKRLFDQAVFERRSKRVVKIEL